jgi:hypothetical protein
MTTDFLEIAKKQFQTYKSLGEKAMLQVSDEQLFVQVHSDSNSIGIIVQHLWGNMLSRWTDFLTTDGEKEWRKRDDEFETITQTRAQLMEQWSQGWECLLNALDGLSNTQMHQVVYIRGEAHSVVEAISRQLTHYAYHVGQIVFLARLLNQDNWQSLSIPKGKTDEFNAQKFNSNK